MPFAAKSPCVESGCHVLTAHGGRCPDHQRQVYRDRVRSADTNQVYGYRWSLFRQQFIQMLITAGLAPECGATLPGGPVSTDSQCKAAQRRTMTGLELDHCPALTEAERHAATQGDRRAVDDPFRVQFLCRDCHRSATARRLL